MPYPQSGYEGINWRSGPDMWEARITINGRRVYLGQYDTVAQARSAQEGAHRVCSFLESLPTTTGELTVRIESSSTTD